MYRALAHQSYLGEQERVEGLQSRLQRLPARLQGCSWLQCGLQAYLPAQLPQLSRL